MSDDAVRVDVDGRGVATVTLNRPDVHNAFSDAVVARLHGALARLAGDGAARAVVLRGAGRSFCAGADLDWMRRMAGYAYDDNVADAQRLAAMLHTLDTLPKPTVAVVHGPAFGGGVGLVAACDTAIASRRALFCLSEVRLGLTPATISPYVVAAIGARAARRYALSAERFDADAALALGLVHEVAADPEAPLATLLDALLRGAPGAQADAKRLIADVAGRPVTDDLRAETARRIAERRASDEGRAGVAAFLDKRRPPWAPPS